MELPEMLEELHEMVKDGEINQDDCSHENPAVPDISGGDFCPVCFITNLFDHVTLEEPYFTDETTEAQREAIESLWERYANC